MIFKEITRKKELNFAELYQNGRCALAPMAGVADRAFRELCMHSGAAFCVTEMVSAKGIVMGDRKSGALMKIEPAERPCGIQLFGSDPAVMAKAAAVAMQYQPDFIDINMGCPAPKVVKTGSGSALLADPALASRIVSAVKDAVSVPVSVKFRTGIDASHLNYIEFASALEAGGADFITLHGRTRAQMYAPPTDLEAIAAVKQAVGIPVIGNGDVDSPAAAKRMLEDTGCDMIMVGRGALGAPWIFSQIRAYLETGVLLPPPSNEEKMKIMLAHANKICQYKGEKIGVCEVRKHALWYIKGMRGAAKLRNRFSTLHSLSELNELAQIIVETA